MWKDIEQYNRDLDEFYSHSKRYKIMRDWIPYMDEIARLIDCRPNIGPHLMLIIPNIVHGWIKFRIITKFEIGYSSE